MRVCTLLVLAAACGGPMTAPHSITDFAGICGSMNTVAVAPEGGAETMDNTVIRSRQVVEPRPGYSASVTAGAPLNAIGFKDGYVIALSNDTTGSGGTLCAYNTTSGAWTTLPMTFGALPFDRPGTGLYPHTRFVSANKALYFQSRYGLTKIETVASGARAVLQTRNWTQPSSTGMLSYSTGSYVDTSNPISGNAWLATGFQAAWRFTIVRKGANSEVIESEPSERIIGSNASGSPIMPVVYFMSSYAIPDDASVRLYRSKAVANGTDPDDEMFLVREQPISATPLFAVAGHGVISHDVNGFVIQNAQMGFVDSTPDSALYVPLYTNAYSGTGIASQNTPSPLSADMAFFKQRMHHLYTSDVQRLIVKVIGTGTGGIQIGDSFTVAGVKLSFATAPTPTAMGVYTGGTVAQNIENTAREVVRSINRAFLLSSAAMQYKLQAFYLSSTSTDAGQILIQSILPGSVPFSFLTSSASGWDKDYTAGTTSDPNTQVAGWMWSNEGEPEGVPTANNDIIGDSSAAGYRLIALRDTLFALKADGLWRITDDGSTVGPQLQVVDPTVKLIAPESAVALDNFILGLADQGVVLISETGSVVNISHQQIEQELFKLIQYVGASTMGTLAFGIANQPKHEYILALPESPNATSCTVQYIYNLQTQTWNRWTLPGVLSGGVNPDTGQLVWGRTDGTLWLERKAGNAADYQDPGFTIASPTATQTSTLTFSGDLRTGATPFAVGDIVQQFQATNALQQRVVGVAYSSTNNQTTVTLDAVPRYAWNQVASLTVIKAIQATMRFLPFHAGESLTDKNWADCYLSMRNCSVDAVSVGWASELYPLASTYGAETAVERINDADGSDAPIQLQAWAPSPWGRSVWGRQTKNVVLKCTMPQDFNKSAQLTLTLGFPCALGRFELNAIDVKIDGSTNQVVR